MAMFGRATADPRPVIPALGQYYSFTSDLAYLIVRVTAGLMLIPHGWAKINTLGVGRVSGMMANYGMPMPTVAAYLVIAMETIGGVMIAIGLFTRVVAAMLVFQFAIIIFLAHWPKGYSVGAGGIEYPLMWGLVLLAVLLRGGGPWSVDRKLGWEV